MISVPGNMWKIDLDICQLLKHAGFVAGYVCYLCALNEWIGIQRNEGRFHERQHVVGAVLRLSSLYSSTMCCHTEAMPPPSLTRCRQYDSPLHTWNWNASFLRVSYYASHLWAILFFCLLYTWFPRLLESAEFFPKISRTWKVLKNELGPWKSWNLSVAQLNQYAFYV